MKRIVIFPYHPDIETLLQWLGELKTSVYMESALLKRIQ